MTPERWSRVREAYLELSEQPAAERTRRLAALRAEGMDIAECVERMLCESPSRGFLGQEEPPGASCGPALPKFKNYHVLELIMGGGMGMVYRAKQSSPMREVAIKVLSRHALRSERDVQRFVREANAVAQIRHPGIVTIHEAGEEDGNYFFSMELVDGKDLGRALENLAASMAGRAARDGLLPEFKGRGYARVTAEIGAAVADALNAAHERGIVHRDVKPSNILIQARGGVKLVDFGISRDENQGVLTAPNERWGTIDYMSPEQVQAHTKGVDERTDVYSLGVVLYEMLTLRRPYADTPHLEVPSRIAGPSPPVPIRKINPTVPYDLQVIVQTAMAKDSRHRYRDAAALRDDLHRFLAHEAIAARPPSLAHRARMWLSRNWRFQAALAALAVCIAVSLGIANRLEVRQARDGFDAAAAAGLSGRPWSDARAVGVPRLAELVRTYPAARLGEPPRQMRLLAEALASHRDAELAVAQDDLRQSRLPAKNESEREYLRLRGLERLHRLAVAFPDDPELRALGDPRVIYPTVSVRAVDARGLAAPARAALRRIDAASGLPGEAAPLGDVPLIDAPVLPGYYRVAVVFADGGFREFPCQLGLSEIHADLCATRRADESERISDMIAIPGATFEMPYEGIFAFGAQSVTVATFLIDRCEVSNGEYKQFLTDTRRDPPAMWRFGEGPEFDSLPVVDVSWEDAAAFAAWSGKRLPTLAEWILASRAGPASPANTSAASWPTTAGPEERWAWYLKSAVAVSSRSAIAGPTHMFGNVAEWTETMAADIRVVDGIRVVEPSPRQRLFIGGAWDALARGETVRSVAQFGMTRQHTSARVGFRCARSLQP